MSTPIEWVVRASEIIEEEKKQSTDARPPFSSPLNHIPDAHGGCRHCDRLWVDHTITERVLR